MPHRPALVTQADVARAIRAVQSVGLPVVSVVVRPDGVHVLTTAPDLPGEETPDLERRDEHEVVDL